MLYQVIILVCASGLPVGECSRETAYDVIVSPEPQTLGHCALHGQSYIADTAIALDDTYVKVQCRPRATTAKLARPF